SCVPSFQAQVWSPRDRKPIRKSFRELADAVAWRQEAQVALRRGTLRAPSPQTLREAAEEWLAAAEPASSAPAPAIATSPPRCAATGKPSPARRSLSSGIAA